jgi:hypothetical protein
MAREERVSRSVLAVRTVTARAIVGLWTLLNLEIEEDPMTAGGRSQLVVGQEHCVVLGCGFVVGATGFDLLIGHGRLRVDKGLESKPPGKLRMLLSK